MTDSQPGKLIPKRRRPKPTPETRLGVAVRSKRLMVLEPNGATRYEPLLSGSDTQLAQLQRIVGGYIEQVPQAFRLDGKRAVMFVNEDGISRQLPENHNATRLTGGIHRILGTAVVAPAEEVE